MFAWRHEHDYIGDRRHFYDGGVRKPHDSVEVVISLCLEVSMI